ncbi:hypothetical protein GWC95_01380 [Sediminibacterium roseum]|uniref:DUF2116 family Zn-ribbon domain-containing protein n=1 Tax=Sediminibacterium roseum TaxID=1978412 RepID=A0ABW9ZPV3_9BACT|nr:hypothetical protein [Sediminibacterium roseum]NCI48555.1 hypothetical protein [Sediminibacterium roseum]
MTAGRKNCLSCDRAIQGRSDKKFCNDSCRNLHHNKRKMPATACVRHINRVLLRNRRILQGLFTSSRQTIKTPKKKLEEQRFDFRYFTHQSSNRRGQRCVFCYEFGYRVLKDVVMVSRAMRSNE